MILTEKNIKILAGVGRTVVGAALGWVVGKGWISSGALNDIILYVGTIALCGYSIYTKQQTGQSLFNMVLGAARNLGTIGLNYCAARGWISTAQVSEIIAAIGTVAVMFWSADNKVMHEKVLAASNH